MSHTALSLHLSQRNINKAKNFASLLHVDLPIAIFHGRWITLSSLAHIYTLYVYDLHLIVPKFKAIDHFTVVGKVTWPLTGSEAGVDPVLIQTSLLLLCKSSCSHAN